MPDPLFLLGLHLDIRFCSIPAARANGIHVPSRVKLSTKLGVSIPGNNPNSSSREGHPLTTRGADGVAPCKLDMLFIDGAQPACVFALRLHPLTASSTINTLPSRHIRNCACHCQVL